MTDSPCRSRRSNARGQDAVLRLNPLSTRLLARRAGQRGAVRTAFDPAIRDRSSAWPSTITTCHALSRPGALASVRRDQSGGKLSRRRTRLKRGSARSAASRGSQLSETSDGSGHSRSRSNHANASSGSPSMPCSSARYTA